MEGEKEKDPMRLESGTILGRRLPETLLYSMSVYKAGDPEEHGIIEDMEGADRMSQGWEI